jgi:hypothetical protein
MTIEAMKLALEDYLSREMPAGTVIGDPKWWAAKIANVMTGKAVAEVYKQGYDHGVERQEAIQKLSEIEKQTPASKNQWWAKELEGFWGDSDYQVTLDTRRAAKTALTVIFDNSQPKQEQGEPYGYLKLNTGRFVHEVEGLNPMKDKRYLPLYTTPPQSEARGLSQQQRKPLTDEQVFKLVEQDYRMEEYAEAAVQLIRRTEVAHGIKE